MKNITYGYVVVFTIILMLISEIISCVNKQAADAFYMSSVFAVYLWWFSGFSAKSGSEYLGNLTKN